VTAAGIGGLLLSLANPPADIGALAFVSLVPLLWFMQGVRPRRGALLGLVFGLLYYGVLLQWLLPFGVIAWLPLVASQAAWLALFGALLPLLARPHRPARTAVAAAALWTAIDWARGTWPIGGFTWGGLGYTQHGNRLLLPLASLTGVWGVTFVVALVNGAAVEAVRGLRSDSARRRIGAVALATAAAAAALLPALIPSPGVSGHRLDVAVVQGNVPLAFASDRLLQTTTVVANHIRLHRTLAPDPPQLAVWPENSLYGDPTADARLGSAVSAAIASVGASTLVGALADAPGDRFYNQALLYTPQGRIGDRYTKIHLVPFGEYIPFKSVFGWTERYRRGNALLAPGRHIHVFNVAAPWCTSINIGPVCVRVAAPICFENVFPDLFRRFVAAGANIVVVTTNDSSFLFSPASREHVIMSQMRAVETGRWIVQAAISGESAFISPRGDVVRHTSLFTGTILRMQVPLSSARTPYTRFGDWFPWTCGVLVSLALMAGLMRRRRRGSGTNDSPAAPSPPAGERKLAPVPISGAQEPRVLVVLPTYNERATIETVVDGVLAAGPRLDALVVDDSSPDGTGDIVSKLAEREDRVRLIRRPRKQGLASAYLVGFRMAIAEGYDIIVEMDADLSHRPEDLPPLLEGSATFDLTIGSRYVPGGGVSNWSRFRVALSKAGNVYARAALRLPVNDATSGFRAYRRPVLQNLLENGIHSEGYAFQVELAYRAFRRGFTVGEVPITFREREHGKSKLSRRIVLEALLKVARWGLQDRLGRAGHR
jgi:apolipoprotein N-acyltransferase